MPKAPTPSKFISVEDFYTSHAESLQLKLIAGATGLHRRIREGSVNRPGLAMSGFFTYFAEKRVQVMGSAETSYMRALSESTLRSRVRDLFRRRIPCFLFARNINPPPLFLQEAEEHQIPIFKSPMITMRLVNAVTIFLEADFAPQTTEHSSMVDIMGIGTLIRGKSGIGKSECVLSLVERGFSLVSDDMTKIRLVEGRELIGTCPNKVAGYHMEVRGLGIIHVGHIFGVGSIRAEKRVDLVVSLIDWDEIGDRIDRLGMDQAYYEILAIRVPHVIIPVRPGRDMAKLIQVAAMDQKLKLMGYNSALEFNQRLIQTMNPG
ncbi:MAG: HPr(Ser) kinase/phosphatase [Verrucomicrobiae bacterium]|nr:HPr(Ser) kinase/phosphatase [Verrucomicrobiae bacterium]